MLAILNSTATINFDLRALLHLCAKNLVLVEFVPIPMSHLFVYPLKQRRPIDPNLSD